MISQQKSWTIAPLDYLQNWPPIHEGERVISQYVQVRDGNKLAVDVHLPGFADNGEKLQQF